MTECATRERLEYINVRRSVTNVPDDTGGEIVLAGCLKGSAKTLLDTS